MSLRTVKLLLVAIVGCFVLATAYMSMLIIERQAALAQVSRYNTSWLASQALAEFLRVQQRVSAFGVPESGIDKEEVELRFDILLNRLKLLEDGQFHDFVQHDPDRSAIIRQLNEVVAAAQPLSERIEDPGAVQRVLPILAPL